MALRFETVPSATDVTELPVTFRLDGQEPQEITAAEAQAVAAIECADALRGIEQTVLSIFELLKNAATMATRY